MQAPHVLEVVVFKVKPAQAGNVAQLREDVRETIQSFPGLIEFAGYAPLGEGMFADIVKWDSHAHANAAAQAIQSGDARFAPYMQAIEELVFMGHFQS